MAISFRIIGNAIPTPQHPVNLVAAENVYYFAEKIKTADNAEMMRWYGDSMNANLDAILRTIRSGHRKDVEGKEIDMHTWKKEIRDLIVITKQVEKYLKSLRY
jgi:hypothetical protein